MSYAYEKLSSSALPVTFVIGESAPSDLSTPLAGPAQGFILRGLSNILGHRITRNNWAENIDEMKALSPRYHISAQTPPTLLLHGTMDYMVGYTIAQDMYSALKENDIPCELVTFNELEHQLHGCTDEMVEEYFGKVNSFFSEFSKI